MAPIEVTPVAVTAHLKSQPAATAGSELDAASAVGPVSFDELLRASISGDGSSNASPLAGATDVLDPGESEDPSVIESTPANLSAADEQEIEEIAAGDGSEAMAALMGLPVDRSNPVGAGIANGNAQEQSEPSLAKATQAKSQPAPQPSALPKSEATPADFATMASAQAVTSSSDDLNATPETTLATPPGKPRSSPHISGEKIDVAKPMQSNSHTANLTATAQSFNNLQFDNSQFLAASQHLSAPPSGAASDLQSQFQDIEWVTSETTRSDTAFSAEAEVDSSLLSPDRPVSLIHTPTRTPVGVDTAAPPLRPDTPLALQQGNWEKPLGQQLLWMAQNQTQHAELRVDPPQLGPVEVRLSLHDDQANVTFISHDAAVRDVIENALPKLRDLFDSQGMQLNQANVSDQSLSRQQPGSGEQSPRQGAGSRGQPGAEGDPAEQPDLAERFSGERGRVDHYV